MAETSTTHESSEADSTYQSGDEVNIDGYTIVLSAGGSFSGRRVRWSWYVAAADYYSEGSYRTAEDAVANARRVLGGPRCACGEPATMNASTRRTCAACFDN